MTLFLIRHPETEWNKKGILQGWKDSHLTAKGRRMAEELGKRLKNKKIEIIYSSDSGRCVQTAEIINKYIATRIIKTRELRERNFGIYNGQPETVVKQELDLSNTYQIAPGGESYDQMKERVIAFVRKACSANGHLLLVTSQGPLKVLLEFYQIPFETVELLYEIK